MQCHTTGLVLRELCHLKPGRLYFIRPLPNVYSPGQSDPCKRLILALTPDHRDLLMPYLPDQALNDYTLKPKFEQTVSVIFVRNDHLVRT